MTVKRLVAFCLWASFWTLMSIYGVKQFLFGLRSGIDAEIVSSFSATLFSAAFIPLLPLSLGWIGPHGRSASSQRTEGRLPRFGVVLWLMFVWALEIVALFGCSFFASVLFYCFILRGGANPNAMTTLSYIVLPLSGFALRWCVVKSRDTVGTLARPDAR